ncbi:nickel pincer cofactor biosynthesis protein LarC [Planctomycetota bacterium]
MKIAYFDCFAGAGGDMIAAAMLDAGLDAKFLKEQIRTLGLKQLEIKIAQTKRCGLSALSFIPTAPRQPEHRSLKQITEIISQSKISKQARQTAIFIFDKLANAEATVHGKDPEEIHFHEIGAVDSIVDIVSAAVGLEALQVEKVYCSPISVGGGTVKSTHGLLPVPAPATAELIKNVPIVSGPKMAELLTPTAAAILTTIVDEFGPLPEMKIEAVGCGAGTMKSEEFPNILRLFIGETAEQANADSVCLIETNVDDISGEIVGSVVNELLERGALDVFTTPIYMKHSRPAVKISVICEIKDAPLFEQILFKQAVTFGIRKQIIGRSKLERDFVEVETKFGRIRVKIGLINGNILNFKPEFSDCLRASKEHSVSVKAVQNAAITAFEKTR